MARARQHDSRAQNGLHSEAFLAARVDCDESSHSSRRGVSACDSRTAIPSVPTQSNTGIHSPSDSHNIQTERVVDMKQVRRRVSRRFLSTAPMSSRVRLRKGTSSFIVVA
jgi:hypothetical protein